LNKNYLELYVGAASCRDIDVLNIIISRLEAAPTSVILGIVAIFEKGEES